MATHHPPAGGTAQMSEAIVFFVDLDASLHNSDLSLPESNTVYNTRLSVVRNALKCFLQNHSLAAGGGKVHSGQQRHAASRLNGKYYGFFGVVDGPCELMSLSTLFDPSHGGNSCLAALDQYLPHRTSFAANVADKPISLGTIAQCLAEVQRQQIEELDANPLPHSTAARKTVVERVTTRGILIGSRGVDGAAPSPLLRDPSLGVPGATAATKPRDGQPPIYLDTVLLGVDEQHSITDQVALDLHDLCAQEKLTSFSVNPCPTGLSVGSTLSGMLNHLHHSKAWTHGLLTARKGKGFHAPVPPLINGLGHTASPFQVVVAQPKKIRLTLPPAPIAVPDAEQHPSPAPPPDRTDCNSVMVAAAPPQSRPQLTSQLPSAGLKEQLQDAPSHPEWEPSSSDVELSAKKLSMDALFGAHQEQEQQGVSEVPAPTTPQMCVSDASLAAALIQGRAQLVLAEGAQQVAAVAPSQSSQSTSGRRSSFGNNSEGIGSMTTTPSATGRTVAVLPAADVQQDSSIDRLRAQVASAVVDDSSVKWDDRSNEDGSPVQLTPIPLASPLSPTHEAQITQATGPTSSQMTEGNLSFVDRPQLSLSVHDVVTQEHISVHLDPTTGPSTPTPEESAVAEQPHSEVDLYVDGGYGKH